MPKEPTKEEQQEQELELLLAERYSDGSEWAGEQHEQAREDTRMYAGKQWGEEDEKWGQRTQFPTLTLNQIWSMVNAVSSSEIVNRFEPKFLPRSPEDQELADKVTQVARYIRQVAGAEFVDSGTFRDALITGIGVADWYYDETAGEEGELRTNRIPLESVIWDPSARKQNMEDARWVIRGTWMDVSEFQALFPDTDLPPAGEGQTPGMAMWGRSGQPGGPNSDILRYHGEGKAGFYVPERRSVLVFEMQDWVTETEWRVTDPLTGETLTLDQDRFEEYQKIRSDTDSANGVPAGIPRTKRVYRRSIFAGMNLIRQEEIPAKSFTIKFLTCFEDQQEDGMRWFGLVRPLRDPQKVANRGFSQVVHILATNPKGVLMHEGEVFEDPREAELQWARPNGRIEVVEGALQEGRIHIEKGSYPAEFERITQFCLNAVPRIAAIDPFFMGSSGGDLRRVSGTAVAQVMQQGQMMLSIPFDGLRKFRIDQGRVLMDLMRVFMPEKSTVRVLGEAGSGPTPEFVDFMRGDLDDTDFDIVVGEVPVSPTAQREAWTALTESGGLKALLDMGLLDGEDIADLAADWPEDVRRRVREKAQRQRQMQEIMMAQGAPPEQGGQAPPPGGQVPPTVQ